MSFFLAATNHACCGRSQSQSHVFFEVPTVSQQKFLSRPSLVGYLPDRFICVIDVWHVQTRPRNSPLKLPQSKQPAVSVEA